MPKLVNIEQLIPPEERARRVARHKRFWAKEQLETPLICPISWPTNYTNIVDPETAARKFTAALEFDSRCGGDNIPAFSCMMGTCALASAFGGKTTQMDNGLFWIDPVVRRPEDVYKLKPPRPLDGLVGKAMEKYLYACDRIEGYVPPRVPDMQGPLNTASMIWEQENFLMSMYDAPDAVHHLLSLVTDHLIAVFKHFRDNYPNANLISWPNIYMPQELGVGVTEDLMHLVSPPLYEEFGLPYVNRIADEFGGIFFHCCGVFKQHWPTVRRFHELRGMDTMYAFSNPVELQAAFPDVAHVMWLDYATGVREFSDQGPHAFLRFLLANTPRGIRRIYAPDTGDPRILKEQIELIRNWAGLTHG